MSNKQAHSGDRLPQKGLPTKTGAPQETCAGAVPSVRKSPASGSAARHATLRTRPGTAENTLRTIQSGKVDALMVSSQLGEQVVTLKGGEPAYRLLVEAMSEGAAILSRDGAVLYCNRGFAKMMGKLSRKILGISIQSLVVEAERDRFEALLADARKMFVKGEFRLRCKKRSTIPVYLSLNRFRGFKGHALGMVITNLSEQKRKQAERIKQTETLHRLLLERTISAQEEERRHIARELHDEAGQMLTALLVGLCTLEDSRKLADVKTQARRLREITSKTIDEVGRIARGLHPSVLDDLGLGVALSRYAAEYTKIHSIAVNLTLDKIDSRNLPSGLQITLYRILQETLTNVARHSGAKSVSIQFTCSATDVEVTVTDDGCGFDAEAVAVSSRRMGIHGMQERAAMLGGTVRFISQPKGTRILVQLPLSRQATQPVARLRSI